MTIGEKIKKIRKEKNISQRKLKELSGVSHTQIAKYETNKANPTLETVKKIASALEVNYVELLDGKITNECIAEPVLESVMGETYYRCQKCGHLIIELSIVRSVMGSKLLKDINYCEKCGVRLDWSKRE